jgi:hypothetical protein
VGSRHRNLWRTADGYQKDTRSSRSAGRSPAAIRALAAETPNPLAYSRFALGGGGEGGGIHRTSRALRLDYYALTQRVEQQSATVPDPAERAGADQRRTCKDGARSVPTFWKLPPAVDHGFTTMPIGPCECMLELADTAGAKMRVHLKGVAMPDLAALSRGFWNPGP